VTIIRCPSISTKNCIPGYIPGGIVTIYVVGADGVFVIGGCDDGGCGGGDVVDDDGSVVDPPPAPPLTPISSAAA
jgi:hypothetical protein